MPSLGWGKCPVRMIFAVVTDVGSGPICGEEEMP
jgi:hypothetical protein